MNLSLTRNLSFGQNNRGMSIQLMANNVFNTIQWASIDTVLNSPTFGQVTGVPLDAPRPGRHPVPVLDHEISSAHVPDDRGDRARHGVAARAAGVGPAAAGVPHRAPSSITVNVVVRDKNGNVVRNLTKDDFAVVEDDKPQQITSFDFEELDKADAEAAAAPAQAVLEVKVPAAKPAAPPPAPAPAAAAPRRSTCTDAG